VLKSIDAHTQARYTESFPICKRCLAVVALQHWTVLSLHSAPFALAKP
jgi:hypothetical protein